MNLYNHSFNLKYNYILENLFNFSVTLKCHNQNNNVVTI